MRNFSLKPDEVSLPKGATAQARRVKVGWQGRPVTALSQGRFRAYLYPVFTPAGVAVTAEGPIDHPHHQSISIGTDHFSCYMPYSTDKTEEATYNFYVNDVFQGRAPGRIFGESVESEEISDDHLRIVQGLEWQGPEEWGAPQRRVLALETRTLDIYPGDLANVIDIRSQLRPTEWDISVGPTRHAYFTVRLADGLRVVDDGTLVDSEGRTSGEEITGRLADWVDASGPASHGTRAGVAVFPYPSAAGQPWTAADYGTLTVNPVLHEARLVKRGEDLDVAVRIVAHDGDATEAGVEDLFEAFKRSAEYRGEGSSGSPAA